MRAGPCLSSWIGYWQLVKTITLVCTICKPASQWAKTAINLVPRVFYLVKDPGKEAMWANEWSLWDRNTSFILFSLHTVLTYVMLNKVRFRVRVLNLGFAIWLASLALKLWIYLPACSCRVDQLACILFTLTVTFHALLQYSTCASIILLNWVHVKKKNRN